MAKRKEGFLAYEEQAEPPSEGELYRMLEIEGISLPIYYGYYDREREHKILDPMPVFPNLSESPIYTSSGFPLVNADQPVCECFSPKPAISEEGWCNDCVYLELYDPALGVCRCEYNRKKQTNKTYKPKGELL